MVFLRESKADNRIRIAVANTDETNGTTTLANHTELFMPLRANTRYVALMFGKQSQANAIPNKISFIVPVGSEARGFSHSMSRNIAIVLFGSTTTLTNNANGASAIAYCSFNTGATAGNLQYQFALNAADPAPVVVIQNTCLIVIELGGV